MRISDWSSDVCSSDLDRAGRPGIDLGLEVIDIGLIAHRIGMTFGIGRDRNLERMPLLQPRNERGGILIAARMRLEACAFARRITAKRDDMAHPRRSEEHTSELQSLMRNSYAVFCSKKKRKPNINH